MDEEFATPGSCQLCNSDDTQLRRKRVNYHQLLICPKCEAVFHRSLGGFYKNIMLWKPISKEELAELKARDPYEDGCRRIKRCTIKLASIPGGDPFVRDIYLN